MASSPPVNAGFGGGDDDEFDWEAAVREIDSACQGASVSTSDRAGTVASIPNLSARGSRHSKPGGPACGLRQSTLDRFVGGHGRCRGEGSSAQHFSDKAASDVGGDTDGDQMAAVTIDLEAAETWVYPVNIPTRDYQFSIAETALFSNTLVALPTGLGKTLIAAVVMYNYFRWFPGGKIVFAAPSRPLVMQQIEACHKIVGIPQEWTIDMTGQMNPQKRSQFWEAKRVFFVTPQVLEKDIQSGICPVKQLVCLVIDEAHRALGNYSYCVALMAVPVRLRVLALTATPGSKQQTIQSVIDNLQISTLEYRDEHDHDVSQYVHNRRLELIEVPMCKDAVEINNMLLEAIQPLATGLRSIGVLRSGDFATLSPCELLNSRDKFRQAPPSSLPMEKHNEVEGYFGVLITVYHIRKLLSSHGIRPAYEMLEEKLKQGSFARFRSKVQKIWNAKCLMQKSLSHGAPNPKLEKMKEVLVDHFEMQDPKHSRVIIFSNFRGSVRDIMNSLSEMGEVIKATEFIGQSSGKTLKGQTQKVQQAVLQKFRAGGYNVIVATSIGEEGLDIMEVDLVICFDANISPLRMIQRMGRTGRKHDGRVVILACEGSELKGYLRKQANSRAVRKHMHSGGIKSFDFHPSPRMVPHICKPQVQCVELSIEQFVPRGKKVGDGFTHRSPVSKKMSKEEKGLIARYFHSSKEDSWKPSLIAFPSFQAFASRVHKVSHSYKTTGMLIDAMQRLQGPSFFVVNQVLSFEVNTSSDQTKEIVAVAHESNCGKVFEKSITVHHCTNEAPRGTLQVEDLNSDKSSKVISEGRDGSHMPKPNLPEESISVLHHFLFGEEFVTVNVYGDVSILSVPTLPSTKETPRSKSVMIPETFRSLNNTLAAPLELTDTSRGKYTDNKEVLVYASPKFDSQAQKLHRVDSILLKNPISGENLRLLKDYVTKVPVEARNACSASQVCKTANAISDMELSPRLTHFIEKGVVPESPTVKSNHYLPKAACSVGTDIVYEHEECGLLHVRANIHEKRKISDTISHSTTVIETPMKNNSPAPANDSPCSPKLSTSLPSSGIPKHDKNGIERAENSVRETDTGKCNSLEPLNEHTPLVNRTNDSCSEDWKLSSAKVSKSIHQSPKYRRLRKHCDIARNLPCKNLEENFCSSVTKFCQRTNRTTLKQAKDVRGKQKDKININYFIEEEAMVSSDVEVSEDEKDDKDEDAYDDSFIDDGTNSAEASIRTKSSGSDMMAFYRRSLLTQSPMAVGSPLFPATCANELSPRTAETASCSSERVNNSLQTPGNGWQHGNQSRNRNLITFKTGIERENSVTANGVASQPTEEESKLESRKRKLSFQHVGLVSAISLRQEHQAKTECIAIKSAPCQPDHNDMDSDVVFDDDFYKGLDLDAVEAQATKLLRDKSETCAKQQASPVPSIKFQDPDENLPAFPSFDLGIHFS